MRGGHGIFFQGLFPKFWERFCLALDRADLAARYDSADELAEVDEAVHAELTALFATRDRDDWMALFQQHDIPAGPANTPEDLARDPHFLARDNVYEVQAPGVGRLRLTSTPVKAPGQGFAPSLAPVQWQHSDEVLGTLLGIGDDELRALRQSKVVF